MRIFFICVFLLLAGCQGGLFSRETPASPPAESLASGVNAQSAAKSAPAPARLLSGWYAADFRHKREDGRGRLKDEFGKFSYWFDEVGPGSAQVRYEGGATYVSTSQFGGTDSAWIQVSGNALLKQGVWVLQTKQGGSCEVRFQVDAQSLRHLSAICEQTGQFGHYAWPVAQSVLKFQRPLRPGELTELRGTRKPR